MNGSERNGSVGDEAYNDIIMVQPRLNSQLKISDGIELEIETPAGDGESKEVPEKTKDKTESQSYEDIIEEDDGEDQDQDLDEEEEVTVEQQNELKNPLKKKKRNLYLLRLIRIKRLALKKNWGKIKRSGAGKTPCILVEKNCKYFGLLEKLPSQKKIQRWLDSMDGSYCTWEELQDHLDSDNDHDDQNVVTRTSSSVKRKKACPPASPPKPKPLNVYLSKEEISTICQGSISRLSQEDQFQLTTIDEGDKKNELDTNSSTIGKHPLSSSSSGSICSEPEPRLEPKPATAKPQGLEVKESTTTTTFAGILSKIFKRQSTNKVSPNEGDIHGNEQVPVPLLVDEGQKDKIKVKDMIEEGENDQKMDKNIIDDGEKALEDQKGIEQDYNDYEDEEIQRLSLLLKSSNKKKTTERTIFSMQNNKVIGDRKKDEKSSTCFSRFFSTYFGCCLKTSPSPNTPAVVPRGHGHLNNGPSIRYMNMVPGRQFQSQRSTNIQQRRNRPGPGAGQRVYPLSASSPAGENFRFITRDQATRNEIASFAELQRQAYIHNQQIRARRQNIGPQPTST